MVSHWFLLSIENYFMRGIYIYIYIYIYYTHRLYTEIKVFIEHQSCDRLYQGV